MRAICLMLTCLVLLAGCGGDDDDKAAPTGTPTPLGTEKLKVDMLTAAAQLDTYRLKHKRYTADETKLGDDFPSSVTVKEAGKQTFYMAARDDKDIRYVMRRNENGRTTRTCDPPARGFCPNGKW